MARLVVNPGSPAAWEIPLKQGDNLIGRGFSNDFKLTDPSVSGSHCQITVSDDLTVIKDLGSTNGTYVNRAPVREANLLSGQTVHLGAVEMVFYSDSGAPAPTATAQSAAPVVRMVGTPVRATAAPVAVPAARTTATIGAVPVPPPIPVPPSEEVPPAPPIPASGPCKHHPKTAGRFFCGHCQAFYCELCVNTRQLGGVAHKFCRHCGAECVPVRVQAVAPVVSAGFFSRIPSAFIYPFRGGGILVIIVSALVFAGLDFLSHSLFGLIFVVIATGYLFLYMQNIIQSTAAGDADMPELPGFDGVFSSFGRLVGAILMSFGLAIVVAVIAFQRGEAPNIIALVGSLAFGCLYFPMALLAVAMRDTVAASNPLVVVPAILKVPLEYLLTVVLMGAIVGVRLLGELVVSAFAGETYTTRDMSVLLIALGLRAIRSVGTIYLLSVNMRILGLLYVTRKQRFGWFRH